jgi:hypothetical protein
MRSRWLCLSDQNTREKSMRLYIARFVALATFALPLCCQAESKFFGGEVELQRWADQTAANFATENYDEAWKRVRSRSIAPSSETDVVEARFKENLPGILLRYGKPEGLIAGYTAGYELVQADKRGTSLLQYTYLVRLERGPLRLVFMFYREAEGWVLTEFMFDTSAAGFF